MHCDMLKIQDGVGIVEKLNCSRIIMKNRLSCLHLKHNIKIKSKAFLVFL